MYPLLTNYNISYPVSILDPLPHPHTLLSPSISIVFSLNFPFSFTLIFCSAVLSRSQHIFQIQLFQSWQLHTYRHSYMHNTHAPFSSTEMGVSTPCHTPSRTIMNWTHAYIQRLDVCSNWSGFILLPHHSVVSLSSTAMR